MALTDHQKKIIYCSDEPIIVVAGSGTDKTKLIANRFVYLCTNLGISPERILCLSVTKKAAHFLERLIDEIWYENTKENLFTSINSFTFHQICQKIIFDDCEARGIDAPKIFSLSSSKYAVQKLFRSHEVPFENIPNSKIIEKLRWLCKSQKREFTQEDVDDVIAKLTCIPDRSQICFYFPVDQIREIYKKFDDELINNKSITLDDIILDARELLQDSNILERWSSRYDAILCEEFHDLDEVQFDILIKLCKHHNNIFCVGNPFQSISGIRRNFFHPFEGLENYCKSLGLKYEIHKLEQNFSTTPEILNVVNHLVSGSSTEDRFRTNLFTHNSSGPKVTLDVLSSDIDQAEMVVAKVSELLSQGVSTQEIAILSRNYSRGIMNCLMCSKINYCNLNSGNYSSVNQELKYLMHWFNVAFLEDSDERWMNSLCSVYHTLTIKVSPIKFKNFVKLKHPKGYLKSLKEAGKKDFDLFSLYQKIHSLRIVARNSNKYLKEKCLAISVVSGIKDYYIVNKQEDKARNIERFLNSSIFNEESWEILSQQILNFFDQYEKQLICGTIQSVKGLKFDHVFLVSMSEDSNFRTRIFQMCKTPEEASKYIDEERRLMYVACTRARKTLHIFSNKEQISSLLQDVMPHLEVKVHTEKS